MLRVIFGFVVVVLVALSPQSSFADTAWFQREELALEYKAILGCGSVSACRKVAASNGAILAEPLIVEVNQWVTSQFGAYPYWIGFTDSASEGNFLGFSGNPPAQTLWCEGEPSGGRSENYVVINWCSGNGWGDAGSTEVQNAVIQRQVSSIAPVSVNVYQQFRERSKGISYGPVVQKFRSSSIDTGIRSGISQWWPLGVWGASFASEFTSKISVSAAAKYTFTVGGDDAVYLFINDKLVISQPGSHGYFETSRRVQLAAGIYTLRLQHANIECCESGVTLILPAGIEYTN